MARPLSVGVQLPEVERDVRWPEVVAMARAAEEVGFDSVVVSNGYIRQNRDTLTRFVKGYVAGAYLALSDEKKAKEVIAQRFKTNDPKVIDATHNDFKRLMPLDAAPTMAGAENVLAQLVAIGIEHPEIRFEIVYGVSGNTRSWYDNSNATRLGYRPQDNAESFSKEVLAREKPADPRSEPYQGGIFVHVEKVSNPAAERQGAKT